MTDYKAILNRLTDNRRILQQRREKYAGRPPRPAQPTCRPRPELVRVTGLPE